MKRLYIDIDKENNKVILYRKDFDYLMSIAHYNDKAIEFIEDGDLLYLASKCSVIYRDNIEVVAIRDRLIELLDILKGSDSNENTK